MKSLLWRLAATGVWTLKDCEEKEEKVTLPGLVIVELVTESGKINY